MRPRDTPGVDSGKRIEAGKGVGLRDACANDAEGIEGWIETLEILSDPDFVEQLRKSEEDLRAGRVVPWVKDSAENAQ